MNDIEKFLNLYSSIISLHPDDCIDLEGPDPSNLTENVYLDKLYVERENYKQEIKRQIYQNPRKIICIVGPQGSGKSTIGMKIRSELLNTGDYVVLFADARHNHWANLTIHEDMSLRDRYREMLLSEVIQFFQGRVFPARPDHFDDNPEWHFFAFLLDRNRHPEGFFFNQRIINEAVNIKSIKRRTADSYYHWLQEYFCTSEGIEFKMKVESSIQPEHYTLAHYYISALKERSGGDVTQRFIFWIDNLDRLPEAEQLALMEAIEEVKNQLRTPIFIVAVREENVFDYDNVLDAGAVQREIIYWRDPTTYDNALQTGALQMPVVDEEFFNKILEQRLSYAKDLQKKKKLYLGEKIQDCLKKLHHHPSDEHLKSQLAKFKEEYELANFSFQGRFFLSLTDLMQRVCKVMFEERMEFVANNSIRILIPMHFDFFKYLIQRDGLRNERPESLDFPDWFLQTELLSWLTGHEVFQLYDIVRHTIERRTNQIGHPIGIGCYLPHLTLTCIWNLAIRIRIATPDHNAMPTIRQVIDELSKLKYTENEIKKALVDLVTSKKERCNLITIPSPHPVRTLENLMDNHRVRLTYRGRTFLNRVACSFGYIFACVRNIRQFQPSKASPADTTQYGREALPLLREVAQAHLLSLIKIREECYLNDKNWFQHYLSTFGVPLERSLTRSDSQFQIGEQISDDRQFRHALYFETLIGSVRAYFHRSNHRLPILDKLEVEFRDYRNRIKNGETLLAEEIIFSM